MIFHHTKPPEVAVALHAAIPEDFEHKIAPFAKPAIHRLLRLEELSDLYASVTRYGTDDDIWHRILMSLNVVYQIPPRDRGNIPARGPVVVVANHPYGGIEGVMLVALLRSVRSDVRVMANSLLYSFPRLRESLIPVDPFGGENAAAYNIRGFRAAIQWLRKGGMLTIFPAGEVAHVDVHRGTITDPAWHVSAAALIRRTSAAALPVFFAGKNGPMFQVLGMIHPLLRTILLPSELLNKRDRTFQVRVGHPLSFRRLNEFSTDEEMTEYLRWRTYLLANRNHPDKWRPGRIPWGKAFPRVAGVTLAREESYRLDQEFRSLPPNQSLIETPNDCVFLAEACQIPLILQEIGRLREITFRSVGEGTGKEIDLDRFDSYYLHLFAWRKIERQIVGAYRLGRADLILAKHGKKGLYTSTLFEFQDAFFSRVGTALELGRSFVRQECQGALNALPLLWRAIGRFVLQNPQYKILFGPVSISNSYHPVSQRLMVSYLQQNHLTEEISRLIKPKTPFKGCLPSTSGPDPLCFKVKDVEELSDLISEIESDGKRVPILLKHYLKLGGKIVGFNVDHQFSRVVDGLILVDLTKTERRILERFVEPDGAQRFLAYHHERSLLS
ncbi:MAG TPA: GNAT family N-acyltransferase [Bacteroidota bacterium]|nr:GNAT family N-acyltransferase [Bacteroidota bacterium]